MAITERTITVLQELSKRTKPARPLEIAQTLQIQPIHVGKELVELAKGGLAVKKDKDKNTWAITDEGTAYLKSLPPKATTPPASGAPALAPNLQPPAPSPQQEPVASTTTPVASTTTPAPPPPPDNIPDIIVPTQADTLRSIGEKLHIGISKGGKQEGTPLDAIIYFVRETADLDDLASVWNALTKMAVSADIRKRWIEIYAKSIPGKEIPDELKEKIESGLEQEKVRGEPKGDAVAPKPKRFSIINGEIIGDPEGDYSFSEALKAMALQQGAGPGQADAVANTIEAMKVGPAMANTLLTALMPLLNKPPDTTMTSVLQQQIQALQTQLVTLTEERHKAEMESIRAEIRTGQKTPESDQQLQLLNQRLDQLRDDLHKKDIEMITTQNAAIQQQLTNQITRLEQQIALVGQGKSADSKIGLMGETVQGIFRELSGARSDAKSMLPTLLSRGQTVKRRTEEEKRAFSTGLDKGIERAKATKEAEEALWPELKGS